jgi:helix-turn-helix protein
VFEIGDSLREARQRRGTDFAHAEQATKIRSGYLRALEDEQFDQLPSPTYVKGFLRSYADFLGLDGQLYVDEYNSRFVVGEHWDGLRHSAVRPARRDRGFETSIVMAALALITVVTVVVISAWQIAGSGKTPPTGPRAGSRPAPVLHARAAFLTIEARAGDSYLAVHRNGPTGRILFQGTLLKGAVVPFSGKYFWINASSPENLTITVAGKHVALTGLKPEALTVTPGGVHAA